MEAPGFCRVTDVSSMKQQGQGFSLVYPANAVTELQAGCRGYATLTLTFVCVCVCGCEICLQFVEQSRIYNDDELSYNVATQTLESWAYSNDIYKQQPVLFLCRQVRKVGTVSPLQGRQKRMTKIRDTHASGCCRRLFMTLICSKWQDMSVASTISTTRLRSSLKALMAVRYTSTSYGETGLGLGAGLGLVQKPYPPSLPPLSSRQIRFTCISACFRCHFSSLSFPFLFPLVPLMRDHHKSSSYRSEGFLLLLF